MNKYAELELGRLLDQWFEETDLETLNIWNKNRVAARIKRELKKLGVWRDKPRRVIKMHPNSLANLKKSKPIKIEKRCECGATMILKNNQMVCSDRACLI